MENQAERYLRYVKSKIRDVHSKTGTSINIDWMNDISMDEVVNVHLTNNSPKRVKKCITLIRKQREENEKCKQFIKQLTKLFFIIPTS